MAGLSSRRVGEDIAGACSRLRSSSVHQRTYRRPSRFQGSPAWDAYPVSSSWAVRMSAATVPYLIQALRLAGEADDHALGGEILAGMSHQTVYFGRADDALDLARAGT
jgi:hypothetical protein